MVMHAMHLSSQISWLSQAGWYCDKWAAIIESNQMRVFLKADFTISHPNYQECEIAIQKL